VPPSPGTEKYEVAVQAAMQVGRGSIPAFVGVTQRRVVLYASYSPRPPRPYEMIDGMHAFPRASVQVTSYRFFGTDGWQSLALKTPEGKFSAAHAQCGPRHESRSRGPAARPLTCAGQLMKSTPSRRH
jgi:hypothetical protein